MGSVNSGFSFISWSLKHNWNIVVTSYWAYLFHVVNHEDDDAAGVEDEDGDDVDEGVTLDPASLLSALCRHISTT